MLDACKSRIHLLIAHACAGRSPCISAPRHQGSSKAGGCIFAECRARQGSDGSPGMALCICKSVPLAFSSWLEHSLAGTIVTVWHRSASPCPVAAWSTDVQGCSGTCALRFWCGRQRCASGSKSLRYQILRPLIYLNSPTVLSGCEAVVIVMSV